MTVESKISKISKIIRDPRLPFCFFTLIISLCSSTSVLSDARVDGFYATDFATSGYFKDKEFAKTTVGETNDTRQSRKKFFITRQERLANPDRAPSNNIKIPQTNIRVSSRLVCLPGFGNCFESSIVYPVTINK